MKVKNLKLKLVITLTIFIYAVVLYLIPGISCPILSLTGIRCPGCGMTRALLSAIHFDFKQAFSYHAMFWAVPVLYISFLFDGRLFKNKYLNILFHLLIGAGFVFNWLFCKNF